MLRRWRVLVPVVSVLFLVSTGCMTAGVNSPASRAGTRRSDTGVIWFWGITDAVKYAEECTSGLAEVRTQLPWYSYIVAPLTLGIVNPVNRQYYCTSA